jgi:hypothetical protein
MMEDSWPLPTFRKYSAYGLERNKVIEEHVLMDKEQIKNRSKN